MTEMVKSQWEKTYSRHTKKPALSRERDIYILGITVSTVNHPKYHQQIKPKNILFNSLEKLQ